MTRCERDSLAPPPEFKGAGTPSRGRGRVAFGVRDVNVVLRLSRWFGGDLIQGAYPALLPAGREDGTSSAPVLGPFLHSVNKPSVSLG